MKYHFKFRSHPKPKSTEDWTITRAEAESALKVLEGRENPDVGDQKAIALLTRALAIAGWETCTLRRAAK